MTFWGIVVAAGRGERFGGPKAAVELGGKPLWRWGRDVLVKAGADGVVVVGDVPGSVPGGERRRDSVAAGLAAVPASAEIVLVHDAARPLASLALVHRVLDRLAAGDVDGVVPVLAVADTLKRVDDGVVVATIERSRVMAAQTPQAFRAEMLRRAYASDDGDATDDAALVERAGGRVAVVAGDPANIKITVPADLAVAEALR